MSEYQATGVLVALFALRCVLPFALTMLVGYGMNRLVAHWERQDAAAKPPAPTPTPIPARRPARPASIPVVAVRPSLPCWVFNNCAESAYVNCAAYKNSAVPCWLARSRADGALPAKCESCAIYRARLVPIPATR